MAITLANAVLVPIVPLHSSPSIPISVYNRKSVLFGASLMTGGKDALTEGNIEDETTVEYVVDPDIPIQLWG